MSPFCAEDMASLTKLAPCVIGAFLDDDVRDTVYLCAGFKVQNSDWMRNVAHPKDLYWQEFIWDQVTKQNAWQLSCKSFRAISKAAVLSPTRGVKW